MFFFIIKPIKLKSFIRKITNFKEIALLNDFRTPCRQAVVFIFYQIVSI